MSERPYLISVDLGPVATAALKELTEVKPKRNQSEVIRDCIIIVHQFQLIGKLADQVQRAVSVKATITPPKKRKASDEEREVVEVYKEVYNYNGNIYWPPALNCIRACHQNGLSYGVIKEMIRISINDPWIGQMIARGDRPQLHTILSEKMVAQLLPKAQSSAEEEADRAMLRLSGEVKPEALAILSEVLEKEEFSKAWDEIQGAMTETEVAGILKKYMKSRHAEFRVRLENLFDLDQVWSEDE